LTGNLCNVMNDDTLALQKGLPGLREVRECLGLTQKQVGEKTGCSADFIRFIENGRSDCSQDVQRQLSQALCCKVSDLFEPPTDPPAPERVARLDVIKIAYKRRELEQLEAGEQEKGVA